MNKFKGLCLYILVLILNKECIYLFIYVYIVGV